MRFHWFSLLCVIFFFLWNCPPLSLSFPNIVLISENVWIFFYSELSTEQRKHFNISFSKRFPYLRHIPSASSESLNSRNEKILLFSHKVFSDSQVGLFNTSSSYAVKKELPYLFPSSFTLSCWTPIESNYLTTSGMTKS